MSETFPNHEPNPLIEENVAELGRFISPDLIIGVIAHFYLEKEKGCVRPSNTEPYLRLVVEAEDDALLEEILKPFLDG